MTPKRMAALVAAALVAVAACGGDDDDASPSTEPAPAATEAPAATGAPEPTDAPATTEAPGAPTTDATATTAPTTEPATDGPVLDRPLKVTSIGYANEITLLWAVEKGLFDKHGIEVERVAVGGGSAAMAAVTTGAVDLGFTNGLSAIQGFSQGFPIQIVLGAYENAYPGDPVTGRGVVVNVNSGVSAPCDLEGKKVGVTELGNIGYQYWLAWLRESGCNTEDVNFVPVPAGQIVAALEAGRVDAIETGGNAVQDLVEAGTGARLGDPMAETTGRVEYAMYIANNTFIEEHPEAIAAFSAAMNESLAQIKDPANEAEWLEIAAKFANTTVESLQRSQMENLDTVVEVEILEAMQQVLLDNGALREPLDLSGLVYTP